VTFEDMNASLEMLPRRPEDDREILGKKVLTNGRELVTPCGTSVLLQ